MKMNQSGRLLDETLDNAETKPRSVPVGLRCEIGFEHFAHDLRTDTWSAVSDRHNEQRGRISKPFPIHHKIARTVLHLRQIERFGQALSADLNLLSRA